MGKTPAGAFYTLFSADSGGFVRFSRFREGGLVLAAGSC
jgi:hypothetical protein